MTEEDRWLDALAGARQPADEQERREQEALRRAARALESGPVDELAEQRLLRRLEQQGLLSPGPARMWPGMRHLARVAVVLLCLGVTLEWLLFTPPTQQPATEVVEESMPVPVRTAATETLRAVPAQAKKQRSASQADQPTHQADAMAPQADAMASPAEPKAPAASQGFAADQARPEARQAAARMEAGPPRQRVPVQDPRAARDELLALVEAQPGIELDADKRQADELRLRCVDQVACDTLNRWLEQHAEGLRFQPAQWRRLQLVPTE